MNGMLCSMITLLWSNVYNYESLLYMYGLSLSGELISSVLYKPGTDLSSSAITYPNLTIGIIIVYIIMWQK